MQDFILWRGGYLRGFPLKGPFWDVIWCIGTPKMIYQWFKEKTAAMCISMSSLLPLSGAADRTGCFRLPLEPLLWLADCDQAYHWSHSGALTISLVATDESHVVMFGYCYRRPAIYLQSVTPGQSANVGLSSRVTVQCFTTEFQSWVMSNVYVTPNWAQQHGTSEEIKRNRWSRTVRS